MNQPLRATIYTPRRVSLYSGTVLDFADPRKESILLRDIADCLARTDAAFADSGFYSLAQRSAILADHVAREEGPLAGCYALLADAATALMRSVPPWLHGDDGIGGMTRCHDRLVAVLHDAVDLDRVCPAEIAKPLAAVKDRLLLRELITLRHNVEPEILRMRHAGVTPLSAHLAPAPRDKAHMKWIGTWKVMATAAMLPHTPAWKGLA